MQLKHDKIVTLYREFNLRKMAISVDIKKELKQLIESEDDTSILEAIRTLLKTKRSDKESKSYDALDEALERSFKDKEAGRVIPHEKVRERYKKWL